MLHFCLDIIAVPGVIERWELIHAQALNKELRMKQKLQQWQQFMSDLSNIMDWLGETEEELEQLRQLDVSTDIQIIEQRIKKLKVSYFPNITLPCACRARKKKVMKKGENKHLLVSFKANIYFIEV